MSGIFVVIMVVLAAVDNYKTDIAEAADKDGIIRCRVHNRKAHRFLAVVNNVTFLRLDKLGQIFNDADNVFTEDEVAGQDDFISQFIHQLTDTRPPRLVALSG